MVQTCLVVKKEIAESKSDPLGLFLKDYQDSMDWANKNPKEAAELLDKHPIGIAKDYAQETIKRSNFVYIASKAESAVEKYLQVLLDSTQILLEESFPAKIFII
jgi:ABC-type nitrate/sulfonate/bicarbonate transport system substrate-binding protein